jgi:tetratricopeptide (TPR) repeat protein
VAGVENDLALVLARAGRLEEAVALLRRALASYARILGREHPNTIAVANNLGSLLVRGPELDEGEALLSETLESRRRLLGDEHPDVARTLSQLGHVARRRGDVDSARLCFAEAQEIDRAGLGELHVEVGNGEANLAALELERGDAAAALPHARRALETFRRVLPPDHPSIPQSAGVLGRVLAALGELDEAGALLHGSLADLERLRGERDPATLHALADLAAFHRAHGAPAEAKALERRLHEARGMGAGR